MQAQYDETILVLDMFERLEVSATRIITLTDVFVARCTIILFGGCRPSKRLGTHFDQLRQKELFDAQHSTRSRRDILFITYF